jgi:hypothetical protein
MTGNRRALEGARQTALQSVRYGSTVDEVRLGALIRKLGQAPFVRRRVGLEASSLAFSGIVGGGCGLGLRLRFRRMVGAGRQQQRSEHQQQNSHDAPHPQSH